MKSMPKTSVGSRQNNFFATCENCVSPCCKEARPPLTSERIALIGKYLLAEGIDIERPFVRGKYSYPREIRDKYCIFFDAGAKKCKVHPLKPETCVAGPITFDINIDRGYIEWYLKTENICRLAGALHRDKEKLQEHLKSAKMEINVLVNSLSAKELLTILSISEPETFKIGEDQLDSKVLMKLRSIRIR